MTGLSSMTVIWLVLGLVTGAMFLGYSKSFGRARRKVLANGLVIAAVIYVGFAIFLGGPPAWMLHEVLGVAAFSAMAVLGIRHSVLWLAVGWALHMGWDTLLHLHGPGATFAPTWYVVACVSFDLLVAAFIVWKRREL